MFYDIVKMMDFVHKTIDKKDPPEVFCNECGREIGLIKYTEDTKGNPICFDCANEIEADMYEHHKALEQENIRGCIG